MRIKYIALILAAVTIIIFIVQNLFAGFTENYMLVSSDIYSRPWIIITSVFLHSGMVHIMYNMLALALFGTILENTIGSRRFIIIYIAAGIVSSISASFFYPAALGASGAVFGVIGTLAALKPRMTVWAAGVPMPMIVAAGFWLLLDIAGILFPSNIANIAHIAGLAFGIMMGITIKNKDIEEKVEKLLHEEELEQWEDEWM